ncbi:YdcF family protein, partial [Bacillus cereus]
MVIPKYPDVPTLTKKQIDQITEAAHEKRAAFHDKCET